MAGQDQDYEVLRPAQDTTGGPPPSEINLRMGGAPPPATDPLSDLTLPVIPTAGKSTTFLQGNAPPGSEGRGFKLLRGGTRLVTEIGAELAGQKLLAPAKGASALVRLGRSALGAGLGGAAASVTNDIAAPNLGGAPPTTEGMLDRAGATFLQSTAGEIAAPYVSKKLGGLAAPFAAKVTDLGRQARALLGESITPLQMAPTSRILQVVDSAIRNSIFGGGRHRALFRDQASKLQGRADEILGEFGPRRTMEQAGEAIQTGMEGTARKVEAEGAAEAGKVERLQSSQFGVAGQSAEEALQHRRGLLNAYGPQRTPEEAGKAWQAMQSAAYDAERAVTDQLYSEVDTLAKPLGKTISLQPLLDEAARYDAEIPEMARVFSGKPGQIPRVVERTGTEVVEGSDPAMQKVLEEFYGATANDKGPAGLAVRTALQRAGVTPEMVQARDITFMQAHRIRSEFGKLISEAKRSGNGDLKFVASKFFQQADEMMEAAAKDDQGLMDAYRTATGAYKAMKGKFEEGILATVAEKHPRVVVDTLIKEGSVDDILTAQAAVGKEAWRNIQSAHTASLLRDDATGGWASPEEIRKRISGLRPETIEAVYGKSGASRLTDYVKSQLSADQLAILGQQTGKQVDKLKAATAQEATAIRRKIPEAFNALATAIKDKDTKGVRALRQLVGEQDWTAVQSAKARELFQGDGETLSTGKEIMDRLHAMSKETSQEVFGDKTDGIWQFARIVDHLERKPKGAGVLAGGFGLAQGSALVSILSLHFPTTAATVLGLPFALSRIVLNPTGRKWLTTGLAAQQAGDAGLASRAFSQLGTWAVKEGILKYAASGQPGPPQPTVPTPATTGRGAGPGPRAGFPPPRSPDGPPAVSPQ